MSMDIKINAKEWRQYLKRAPELYEQVVRSALKEVNLLFEREIRINTERGATGNLRKGVFMEITGTKKNLTGTTAYNNKTAPYSAAVDLGSKPHFPPIAPLVLWARRKLGVSGDEALQVAWGTAIIISRFGTRAKNVVRDAFKTNRNKALRIFEKAGERLAKGK